MSFAKAIAFSLRWEGGYVNDPDDPGGETKHGISKRAHPDLDIKALTLADATRIYQADYWEETGALLATGGPLAAALFDFGIHSGSSRAISELQRLVGATPDGRLGPLTRRAIDVKAFQLLAVALVDRRRKYLEDLVANRPRLAKFAHGWSDRLHDLVRRIRAGYFSLT